MPKILTANHLADGLVVFRDAAGAWQPSVDAAALLDGAALAAAEAAARTDVEAALVVDVAAIDAAEQDGHIVPLRLRERIRAHGPTMGSEQPVPHR